MDNLADKARGKRPDGRVSTKAAVLILAAVAVVAVAVVAIVLHMAKVDNTSSLSDKDLSEALEDTVGVTPSEAGGHEATGDTLTTVAVYVGADKDGGGYDLSGLYLVVLNQTRNKGYLVSIDPDTCVVADDETTTTFSDLVGEKGMEASIEPLAEAVALPLDHAIEIDASNWELVLGALSGGTSEIVSHATEIISSLRTDMDASVIYSLADEIHEMGLSSIDRMDCPVSDGMVDSVELDVAVGALA
jgi:hypothetical protein